MGDRDRASVGLQLVNQMPGIGGCFQHDRVALGQALGRPVFELDHRKPTRGQDDLLLDINRTDHDIVFVDINGDEPRQLDWWWSHHDLLSYRE